MSSQDLMKAVQLARAGEKDTARQILLRLVQQEPANEMAWIWLVDTMPSDAQRMATLKQCLKHLPDSENARKALAILQARQPAQAEETPQTPEVTPYQALESEARAELPGEQVESEPQGWDALRQLDNEPPSEADWQENLVRFDEQADEPAFEWHLPQPEPTPAASRTFEPPPAMEETMDPQTLTDLRSQLGKAPAAPMQTVKTVVEAVEVRRSSFNLLALFLIVVLAILLGVAGFGLFFSPISPLRLGAMQPAVPPTSEVATPTLPNVGLTQPAGTIAATQEVTETPLDQEGEAPPLPPGIYLSGSQVYSVDWSRDGNLFVVSSTGGISLYDPRSFETARFLDLADSQTICRFSPDMERLACAGADLRTWNIADWSMEIEQLPTATREQNWINRFEFLAPGLLGLVFTNDPIGVNLFSFELPGLTGERLRAPENIRQLAVAQNGGWLAAGLENGEVVVWNLDSMEVVFQQTVSDSAAAWIALSADGSRLVSASAAQVSVWSVASGERLLEIDAGAPVGALALSVDGESLATASQDGWLTFWEPITGEVLDRREVGVEIAALLFAPDGQALAAQSLDGNIFFYYGWR
ncbi:MAG: WD40 repeat domain-containing protein [Chloroflexota bacterium]